MRFTCRRANTSKVEPMGDAYDEGEHVKHVFAFFGRAFYMAGVLETGLALAILQLEFLTKVSADYVSTRGEGFDRSKFEGDFDAFMERQHAQTLGNLMRRVELAPEFDAELKAQLRAAKKRRDFLGHHFFRERAVDFAQREGRDRMIAELQDDADMFENVDAQVQAAMRPVWSRLGLSNERRERFIEDTLS